MQMSGSVAVEKALRDLSWVAQSPCLVTNHFAEHIQRQVYGAWQEALSSDPARILAVLPKIGTNLPLGRWFESLLDCGLRLTFGSSNVHKGVLDEQGGELDFVVCTKDIVFHIECAVKYFLHRAQFGEGLAAYVGPVARDRLDLKYKKMVDLQLGRAVPSSLVGERSLVRVLWLSGCIFYPHSANASLAGQGDPTGVLNPSHQRGEFGAVNEIFPGQTDQDILVELPPLWWITSLQGLNRECLDLFSVFKGVSGRAQMVARIQINSDLIVELARGFVI
ncbi:MAG: DUF1853 family protein [bacterium]